MQSNLKSEGGQEPRLIALLIVNSVLEKGAYTNIALDKHLKKVKLAAEDRHLVTEIVNGTIRMVKHLDWVLNLFLQKPLTAQNPWLKNILRISVYQMLFMERVPDYACVDSAVRLSRAKAGLHLSKVANGVLRNIARNRQSIEFPGEKDSIEYLSVYYSQPEWLVKKWLDELGSDSLLNMLKYFNLRPAMVFRTNRLLNNREELMTKLISEGASCMASPRTPWGLLVERMDKSLEQLDAYREGRFYVQNEASMLPVSILSPQSGEHIIDLCSGVGGKTTFIAEEMGNSGQIDAYEIYAHKLSLLADNCKRLGVSIVRAHQDDIMTLEGTTLNAPGIILDAPCSGLGVLNRRSDSRWNKTPESIAALLPLQSGLIAKAGQMLDAGGRMVYCTCTTNRAENEDIVTGFLEKNPDFYLEGFGEQIGYFPLDESDMKNAQAGMLTLLPGKYGTDGMFYALIRRSGNY